MKFYNRKEELKELKKAIDNSPSLILIRGRRKVGKTALLRKALEKTDHIYFYIDANKTEKQILIEFEKILKKELDLPTYVKVESWEDFYNIIFSNKKHIAIDEFQRLYEISPSAIYSLQNHWDEGKTEISLILSGSNVGMIKKIFIEKGAPLFKRATHDLFLKPLTFAQCREIFQDISITDIEEQVKIYSLVGGIPYYYVLLEKWKVKNSKDAINSLFLNQLSPLKNEVRDTMIESFGKGHPSYYSVINAIAMGKSTKKEISDFSGIKDSSISPYLYDLENLVDIVEYRAPITEKKEWKTRMGRFFIKDNLMRFWFNFIYRNMSYYQEQDYQYLQKLIKKDFESHVGLAFEQVCKEFMRTLNRKNKLHERYGRIGRWWNRKGEEIDIILVGAETITLVECKWSENTNAWSILNSLKEKEKFLQHNKSIVKYCVISRGFSKRCDEITCYDIKDIEKVLK